MFSSKKILELDSVQFTEWLSTQPAGARKRIFDRIVKKPTIWMTTDKKSMIEVYKEWMTTKETAVKKLLEMSEETKKDMPKEELAKLKKELKELKRRLKEI